MKKLASITLVAILAAFTLTSCKKDWDCTCTDAGGNVTVVPINDAKEDDAKAACDILALGGGTCVLND